MGSYKIKAAVALLSAALFVMPAGCSGSSTAAADQEKEEKTETALSAVQISDRDKDGAWDIEAAVTVTLSEDGIIVDGKGAQAKNQTLTISMAGTYVLSGRLDNGQIIVDADKTDKVQVVLNGVDITCQDNAPFYVKQADKVFVTLAEGSENSLTDGEAYRLEAGEDEPDAALFSKEDLTINGTGSLTVTGSCKDGIVSKDDLVIAGGEITVTAKEDGIRGKESLCACAGTVKIEAGYDGMKSTEDIDEEKGFISIEGGVFHINAGYDGIQAETELVITGGEFNISAGGGSSEAEPKTGNDKFPGGGPGGMKHMPDGAASGSMLEMPEPPDGERMKRPEDASGDAVFMKPEQDNGTQTEENTESMKGIKAGKALVIMGGTFNVDSCDDALHSNGPVTVSGGTLTLKTGDDGIHADGALTISGGFVEIQESYEGLEGTNITITDGTLRVTASDDGLNAAGENGDVFLLIEGGNLFVDASGDGIDSNGTLEITGGVVLVNGSVNGGNGALDYEKSARITGGIIVAAGSTGMAQNFTESEGQASIMVNFNEVKEAGTKVTLTDEKGNILITCAPAKKFQSVIISAPSIQAGETFTLYTSGTAGEAEGIETGGRLEDGEKVMDITVDETVISISEDGSQITGGGFMGRPRGRRAASE